jgi:hypothetical protein
MEVEDGHAREREETDADSAFPSILDALLATERELDRTRRGLLAAEADRRAVAEALSVLERSPFAKIRTRLLAWKPLVALYRAARTRRGRR